MGEKIVGSGIVCQCVKSPVALKMSQKLQTPWHTDHLDFHGPFPTGEIVRSTATRFLFPNECMIA